MLEIDCTVITPEPVLKASGHVDKFADWMCKDPAKGEYLRADHLVETVLEARLESSRSAVGGKQKPAEMDDALIKAYESTLAQVRKDDNIKPHIRSKGLLPWRFLD